MITRRSFVASLAAFFGLSRVVPPVEAPPLLFHRDAFAMVMESFNGEGFHEIKDPQVLSKAWDYVYGYGFPVTAEELEGLPYDNVTINIER